MTAWFIDGICIEQHGKCGQWLISPGHTIPRLSGIDAKFASNCFFGPLLFSDLYCLQLEGNVKRFPLLCHCTINDNLQLLTTWERCHALSWYPVSIWELAFITCMARHTKYQRDRHFLTEASILRYTLDESIVWRSSQVIHCGRSGKLGTGFHRHGSSHEVPHYGRRCTLQCIMHAVLWRSWLL